MYREGLGWERGGLKAFDANTFAHQEKSRLWPLKCPPVSNAYDAAFANKALTCSATPVSALQTLTLMFRH